MSAYSSQEFSDGWDDIPPSFQEQILQSVAQLESAALASKSIQSSASNDTRCNKKQKRDYMDEGKNFQVYNDPVVSTIESNSVAAKRKILHDMTNQQQETLQYIDKDDSIKLKVTTTPMTTLSSSPHLDSTTTITTTANNTRSPTQMNNQITKVDSDDESMWLEFDDMDIPALLDTIDKTDSNNNNCNSNSDSDKNDNNDTAQPNGAGMDKSIMATLAQYDDVLQTYGGFQTAGSRKDIKPSGNSLKAAHDKALDLMAEPLPPSSTTSTTTGTAPSPDILSTLSANAAISPSPTNTPSNTFSGFSTARGTKLNEPSLDAKNTAQQLFLNSPTRPSMSPTLASNAINPTTTTTTTTLSSGFSTGRGTKLSEPSAEAKRKAQQLLLTSPTRPFSSSSSSSSSPPQPAAAVPLVLSTTTSTTDTQPSLTVKSLVLETPSLSSIYNYEDVIQQYGGFSKASGKKSDTVISDAAKQQALLLFSSDMSASQLTQPSIYQHNNGSSQCDSSSTIDTHSSLTLVDISSTNIESSAAASILTSTASFSSSTSTVDLQQPSSSSSDQIVVSQSSPSAINTAPTKSTGTLQRKRRQLKQQQSDTITQRPRSKPFKSPAVNLDLVKAGLEKKQAVSIVKRMKGPSVFSLHSTGNRQPLSSLGPPRKYTKADLKSMNIPVEVLNMTPCKARSYVFETNWGVQEATKELLAAGGLSSMLPLGWVENHYGWIVFKLARYLSMFAHHYKDGNHTSWWSPTHVLKQLLYRYERDINLGQRSVLKRIMEQDDVPVKQMVLMVADIVSLSSTTSTLPSQQQQGDSSGTAFSGKVQHRYRLQLTDGWYQISTFVDARMNKMIDQGRVYIGQKLTMTGAQLIGDRTPKTPLEALTMATMKPNDSTCDSTSSSSLHDSTTTSLLISSNSCLPCSWDTKLGYPRQRQRRHVIRRLNSNIYEDGGLITMMDVMICKKYPMMYSETLANGTTVQRNSKDEEDYRRILEIHQHYNHRQHRQHHQATSRLENGLEDRRVSGYFRLRICDIVNNNNSEPQVQATLMVSQATEVIHMDLLEGQRYRLFFVQPYQPKSRYLDGPYLITTRLTKWEPLSPKITTSFAAAAAASKDTSTNTDLLKYPLRTICPCIKLRDLTGTDVDITVFVLHTQPQTSQSSTDGRNVWYTTLLVTDSSSTLCQFTHRSYYRPAQNMNGQILGLMNVRFDIYDSKCDIIHIKSSDETEIWSKSTGTMAFMQNAMTDLKRWTESHSSELSSIQQRVNNLIQL